MLSAEEHDKMNQFHNIRGRNCKLRNNGFELDNGELFKFKNDGKSYVISHFDADGRFKRIYRYGQSDEYEELNKVLNELENEIFGPMD